MVSILVADNNITNIKNIVNLLLDNNEMNVDTKPNIKEIIYKVTVNILNKNIYKEVWKMKIK